MKDISSEVPITTQARALVDPPSKENPSYHILMRRIQTSSTPTYCGGSLSVISCLTDPEEFREIRKRASQHTLSLGGVNSGALCLDYDLLFSGLYTAPQMYFQMRNEYAETLHKFLVDEELHGKIDDPVMIKVKNGDFTTICIDSAVFYKNQEASQRFRSKVKK